MHSEEVSRSDCIHKSETQIQHMIHNIFQPRVSLYQLEEFACKLFIYLFIYLWWLSPSHRCQCNNGFVMHEHLRDSLLSKWVYVHNHPILIKASMRLKLFVCLQSFCLLVRVILLYSYFHNFHSF